jgi:hypothetical protein
MTEQKVLITTRTGEPYQPSRIYFKVFKPQSIIRSFQKLRCLKFNPQLNAWRWLYENEAQKLRFSVSRNKIPKEYRPLVLGDFYFRGEDELILELRSFDRVVKAIFFFKPHISHYTAKITKLRVVNYFFDNHEQYIDEALNPPFDYFFDQGDVTIPNIEEIENKLKNIFLSDESEDSKANALEAFLEANAKKSLPKIEEISLEGLDEDLSQIPAILAIRHGIAIQHWEGNPDFTEYDFFNQMVTTLSEVED